MIVVVVTFSHPSLSHHTHTAVCPLCCGVRRSTDALAELAQSLLLEESCGPRSYQTTGTERISRPTV